MKNLKNAFTLVEVLIVIAVIGVVAAITIPTLINTISPKAKKAQTDVIEARLLDGINRYSATEDGLSQKHGTTYDFLIGLSNYYKMAQICKADEITNCIPYGSINYCDNNESIEVKTLTDNVAFFAGNAGKNYLEPASFITAQGTPVIMALKKDCVWDMGTAMRNISDSGCIAYMYDQNGAGLPNKFGKDIVPHGLTITGKGVGAPIATIGGVKIMTMAFLPSSALTDAECQQEVGKNYGITVCPSSNTYRHGWEASMKYCHDQGYRLPNETESRAIALGLFKDSSGNHPSSDSWSQLDYPVDLDLVNSLGLTNYDGTSPSRFSSGVDIRFWSSVSVSNIKKYYQSVLPYNTSWSKASVVNLYTALCVAD